jgi:riboflavin synthase
MFTGIITDVGRILSLEERGDLRAIIACAYRPDSIDIGASISCAGVCLTVVERGAAEDGAWFAVDVSAETLGKTNIRRGNTRWTAGRRINLERALRVGDELGGHIVSGHVDGTAEILAAERDGDSTRITLRAPTEMQAFIAPKGSIALDGTSLTVNDVDGADFTVNVIPHTQAVTTWGERTVGDHVNLEIDTLARYVARLRTLEAAAF